MGYFREVLKGLHAIDANTDGKIDTHEISASYFQDLAREALVTDRNPTPSPKSVTVLRLKARPWAGRLIAAPLS